MTMAKKKSDNPKVSQDQPEGDIFDEDEATEVPPTLKPGEPGSQDAPVESQDAPGDVRDQWTEELSREGEKSQEKPMGDSGPPDPRRSGKKKSQDQPEPVRETVMEEYMVDPESEEFRSAFKRFLESEKAARQSKAEEPVDPKVQALAGLKSNPEQVGVQFKVMRGMVGAFPEGSVITDIRKLGVSSSDIPRLLEEGVILPVGMKEVQKS
jgi:hypothetical protein